MLAKDDTPRHFEDTQYQFGNVQCDFEFGNVQCDSEFGNTKR